MNEQECLERMVAPGTRRPGKYREGVVQVWITRACDQENTQGMARRSSIFPVALREAGRLPMCSSAISLIGVDAWK